jgi:hypothetical protein
MADEPTPKLDYATPRHQRSRSILLAIGVAGLMVCVLVVLALMPREQKVRIQVVPLQGAQPIQQWTGPATMSGTVKRLSPYELMQRAAEYDSALQKTEWYQRFIASTQSTTRPEGK